MVTTLTTPTVNPNGTVTTAGAPLNGSNKSRLHIKKLLSNGVEINVFGDDPQTTFELIISVIALCEGQSLPPSPAAIAAHQDRLNHEENTRAAVAAMACQSCGSHNLKLINWTDKKTGKPVSKWRCQEPECMAWQKNI